jgi:hypothetical protein
MLNIIDNFLREYAPTWYRTPQVQTAVLGLIFFWVFAAYTTIQFYAASTYGSELAADSVSALYLTFTLTCLFSPGIINKWGCRRSMFYGVLGYAALVISSLIYFLYGSTIWTRRLVVMGGVILGCGAAILWTAQGRLILQYASREERATIMKQTGDGADSMTTKSAKQSGNLLGMFWAIFQCSSLVGGSISFIYYNNQPDGSMMLFMVFLGFILVGALFTQILLPPESLLMPSTMVTMNTDNDRIKSTTELTPLKVTVDAQAKGANETLPIECSFNDDFSNQSWAEESLGTIKLFFTQKTMILFPLFLYTVSEQVCCSFGGWSLLSIMRLTFCNLT